MLNTFTPLERLILLQLCLNPGQTTPELKESTGAGTPQYFSRTLKVLRLSNLIVETVEDGKSIWNRAPQQIVAPAVQQ